MDTPAIRYARTDDGMSVAYLAVGDGPQTVVEVIGRPSHIEAFSAMPIRSRSDWSLFVGRRYVTFGHRGGGLSARDVSDSRWNGAVAAVQLAFRPTISTESGP